MRKITFILASLALTACAGATTDTDDTDVVDTDDTDDTVETDETDADTDDETDAAETDEPSVVINEILAANDAGAQDEAGQEEDWVELYNPGSAAVDVAGWTLTDGSDPFVFPSGTTIAAGGYLIIWCDDDVDDGPLHTEFKLSKADEDGQSETITLLDADGIEVDSVTWSFDGTAPFGPQDGDISIARLPNGSSNWGASTSPTGGAANVAGE
jgi:hypothetical protein